MSGPVLALTEGVQVALVSAFGAIVVAALAAVPGLLNRRSTRKVEAAIGEPNGQGDVVTMLERILAGQAGQDNRLARLERDQVDTTRRVDTLSGRVDVLERLGGGGR